MENHASVCKWPNVSAETGSAQAGRSHRLELRLRQTDEQVQMIDQKQKLKKYMKIEVKKVYIDVDKKLHHPEYPTSPWQKAESGREKREAQCASTGVDSSPRSPQPPSYLSLSTISTFAFPSSRVFNSITYPLHCNPVQKVMAPPPSATLPLVERLKALAQTLQCVSPVRC